MSNKFRINAFCDGACKGNPGPGGWGVYLVTQVLPKSGRTIRNEFFGGLPLTTNNVMELTAVTEALEHILSKPLPAGFDRYEVNLCVDSKYVLQGASEWMPGWKRNGWRKADGAVVRNTELWQRLDQMLSDERLAVMWTWIKGHSGNFGNEKADELANRGVSSSPSLRAKK